MKLRKTVNRYSPVEQDRFLKMMEPVLEAESEKMCVDIMEEYSDNTIRRCLNLTLMACLWAGLSPKTGHRIYKALDEHVLPIWGHYAATGDGDEAFRQRMQEKGWPNFPTDGLL